MKYRLLGQTGLKVSELCLGTMTFGHNFYGIAVVDQPDANAMAARALEASISSPWSPLSGGFLSGKYSRDNPNPEGARRSGFQFPPIDEARGFDAVEALKKIAAEKKRTVAQVALAWLLAQPGITSIIIGANKMSQLEDNLRASDLELTAAEIEILSATTAPAPLYPEWMIERQNEGRL